MNIFNLLSLQAKTTSLILETQAVVALRLMGMTGVLPSRQDENLVMWAEKAPVLARSFSAGNTAFLLGKRPDEVASAAMAPLATKVRANRKRLME